MKNKLRLFIIIPIALLGISVAICHFLISKDSSDIKNVKKEMQGIRFGKDTLEFIENVTLNINGTVEKGTNMSFLFTGELRISNLDYSKGNRSSLIYSKGFGQDGAQERGLINYPRNLIVNGKVIPAFATVHWVNTDIKLSYLILANYEDDCINSPAKDSKRVFQGNDIIVFPAADVKSALQLLKKHQIDKEIFRKASLEDYKLNETE